MIKFIKVPNIEREEYIVYATKQNGIECEDLCIGYIIKNSIVNKYGLSASRDPNTIYGANALISIAKFINKLNKNLKNKDKLKKERGK